MKNILTVLAFLFMVPLAHSQQVSEDTLHWSSTKKLAWTDFKGKTAGKTGVLGNAAMMVSAKFHKGIKTKTSVETIFDRNISFIADKDKTAQMLKYYQVMFDIHELQSRKLRKELKETKLGLDPEKVFQEKYTAALKELEERMESYQDDTEEGTNAPEVEKWNKQIQQDLKALEAFGQ
jgi:hypothetical protein